MAAVDRVTAVVMADWEMVAAVDRANAGGGGLSNSGGGGSGSQGGNGGSGGLGGGGSDNGRASYAPSSGGGSGSNSSGVSYDANRNMMKLDFKIGWGEHHDRLESAPHWSEPNPSLEPVSSAA